MLPTISGNYTNFDTSPTLAFRLYTFAFSHNYELFKAFAPLIISTNSLVIAD